MISSSMPHNLSVIRELLLAAFTPETLRRFCMDQALFRPVGDQFATGHGLADMVDEVLDYSRTQLLWNELLAGVKQVNPRQYDHYEPQLREQAAQSGPHDEQPISSQRAEESSGAGEPGSKTTFNVSVSGGQVGEIINIDKLEGDLTIGKR